MSKVCHYCGEPGAERFHLNGQEQFFHANMLKDCLQSYLREEQEKYFKDRGVLTPIRGEKFSTVSRQKRGGERSPTGQRFGW